jgi:hypothetical protein
MIDARTEAHMSNAALKLEKQAAQSPSPRLLELCRAYLDLVDHGTREQQGEERTRAHNELIQQMVAEGLVEASPHRVLVRWLARYLVQSDYLSQPQDAPRSYVMFLRRDTFPPRLENLPPFYEKEESSALDYYVPVRVTIEPLLEQNGHVEPE